MALCDIEPPAPRIASQQVGFILSPSSSAAAVPSRGQDSIRFPIQIGAISSMSGFPMQSAGVALLLALSPLLAGCDQPSQASTDAQPVVPDVSIVTVKPQPRAIT